MRLARLEPATEFKRDKRTGRFVQKDNPGYSAVHKWLVAKYGNPKQCVDCGVAGLKNSIGRSMIHWANISGKYQRDIKDYRGLCTSCHLKADGVISNIRKMRKYL